MEKIKLISPKTRVRMFSQFDHFVVSVEMYWPDSTCARSDGWMDAKCMILQTKEQANEIFDKFVSSESRLYMAIDDYLKWV